MTPGLRYSQPLPRPAAGLRAARIRRALTGLAPTDQALELDGFHLLFDEGIPAPASFHGFCPASFLGRNLPVRKTERLLDLATGSGLVALHAARRGARVTAIDWQEEALTSLRRNALMAGLDEPDLRQGEGLEATGDERFDIISWAAPFLPGTARDRSQRRLQRGPELGFSETLLAARRALDRGGRLLIPFPDRDGADWLHGQLESAGFRFAPIVLEGFPILGKVRLYQAWTPATGIPTGQVAPGEPLPGAEWVLRDR